VAERGARRGKNIFFCCQFLGQGVVIGSRKVIVGVFFFLVLFHQSQSPEWGRGGRGVAGQPGMREQRRYILDIATSQL